MQQRHEDEVETPREETKKYIMDLPSVKRSFDGPVYLRQEMSGAFTEMMCHIKDQKIVFYGHEKKVMHERIM